MTAAAAILALALAATVVVAVVLARRAREARAALDDARDRATRAEHARDAFFDLATHELRSPLAAILGYQELLQDGAYGQLPEPAAEPVVRIGRSAKHLLNLIDGVVELSRLRAGGLKPEMEPVNLAVVMSGVADAFRTHARERGLEPNVDMATTLPIITSDLDRLLRALDLLITSAVKYPEDHVLTLSARSSGDDLEVHIHPTRLTVHDDSSDPALRLGIRLAVAGGVAELLGGGLELETDEEGDVVSGMVFRVRDLGGQSGSTAV